MKKLKIISLFSGAGGLDLGLESSGHFESLVCIEANKIYASTLHLNKGLRFNAGHLLDNASILSCTVRNFLDNHIDQYITKEIDGIIGGPPCQPFSTMGRRLGMADPRSTTLNDYSETIRTIKPKLFIFENVPNLAWQWNGGILKNLLVELEQNGLYRIEWQIVNAANYGARTKRRRLVMIGIRVDCLANSAATFFPIPTHAELATREPSTIKPWETVADALGNMQSPNTDREVFPTHHVAVTHTDEVIQRFRKLQPGEQDKKRKRWRLDINQPSNSLMAGGDGGFVFHIHPTLPRELTARECARIQGFPDEYRFAGKPLDVAKQIVNAVPVQLGFALAKSIAASVMDK